MLEAITQPVSIPIVLVVLSTIAAVALWIGAYFGGQSDGYKSGHIQGIADGQRHEARGRDISVQIEVRQGRDGKWGAYIGPAGAHPLHVILASTQRSKHSGPAEAEALVREFWPGAKIKMVPSPDRKITRRSSGPPAIATGAGKSIQASAKSA